LNYGRRPSERSVFQYDVERFGLNTQTKEANICAQEAKNTQEGENGKETLWVHSVEHLLKKGLQSG
jgi:hypothetical protein